MKLDKICEALSQTDELCYSTLVNDDGMRCTIGQLIYASGDYSKREIRNCTDAKGQIDMLVEKYDISEADRLNVVLKNNYYRSKESPKARHTRMIKWFENLLIDELIMETVEMVEVEVCV